MKTVISEVTDCDWRWMEKNDKKQGGGLLFYPSSKGR